MSNLSPDGVAHVVQVNGDRDHIGLQNGSESFEEIDLLHRVVSWTPMFMTSTRPPVRCDARSACSRAE